jgi:site-specific DNA recombinase
VIVDGYVRVSQVAGRSGERFISPSVQREQIERWARVEGAVVAHVFEELDESGARADRPLLQQAIDRVEGGDSDGIVVAYLSRFGRSLIGGLAAIERITRAGGKFVSVQDGIDFSTDSGRLILRFLFSVAEWERDRMLASWMTAQARAVARGAYIGPVPFGYTRREDGRLVPDAEAAPVVAELFRRRGRGVPCVELAALLTDGGFFTGRGNKWHPDSVRTLLRHRVYLGEYRRNQMFNPSAHPALIDETTWERAQTRVTRPARKQNRPDALLAGVLRCVGCSRLLHPTLKG